MTRKGSHRFGRIGPLRHGGRPTPRERIPASSEASRHTAPIGTRLTDLFAEISSLRGNQRSPVTVAREPGDPDATRGLRAFARLPAAGFRPGRPNPARPAPPSARHVRPDLAGPTPGPTGLVEKS